MFMPEAGMSVSLSLAELRLRLQPHVFQRSELLFEVVYRCPTNDPNSLETAYTNTTLLLFSVSHHSDSETESDL